MKKKLSLLMTLLLCAVMGAWADTVVLDSPSELVSTHSDASGIITITDATENVGIQKGNGTFTYGDVSYFPMKLSDKRQFNLTYKEGVTINKVTLIGTSNSSDAATLGTSSSDRESLGTLPAKGSETPLTVDITNVTGLNASAQFNAIIVVEYTEASATQTEDVEVPDVYTVAGSSTTLFGSSWSPADANNDMTLEEGVYVWTKSDVTLPAGKVMFKVVKNHTWDEAYPASDYVLSIETSGKYTVTITFNAESKTISAFATKTEDVEVPDVYTVAGTEDLTGYEWDATQNEMTLDAKTGIYSWSAENITVSNDAQPKFKIVKNGSEWIPAGTGNDWVITPDVVGGEGIYTITITYNPASGEDGIFVSAFKTADLPAESDALVPNGKYYVMNAGTGAVVNAEGAVDTKGAPITFTYDAATKTYTIEGADIFADKRWIVANMYEDMPGYFYFSTVVDGATKYLTVDAENKLTLADDADDNAIWIVLDQTYWEDIVNSTYTVVGTKNLTNTENDWDVAESNQMTYNEETQLFEITFNNITVTNDVKPEFKVVKTPMEGENIWYPENNWVITPEVLAGEGEYDITITFNPSNSEIDIASVKIEDINITPENGADIFEALTAAERGKKPRNISINLVDKGSYTVSGPLNAYANFEIQGNGSIIDASNLNGNLIQMVANDNTTDWTKIAYVSIHNATVKGLKKPLFYSGYKNYGIDWLTIDNSVIELAGDATCLDFTKGSAARNVNIEKSTVYAPTATSKPFYSSQGGQKLTELDEEGIQTFIIKNSTMYNLTTGKNFFIHRQANQKWMAYDVENSIFVNCGKNGQVIKGMNGGQSGSNPTWTINGNVFNFEADGVMTDTSAAEDTGDTTEGEGVQNSVAGIVVFNDAYNGDFNGYFLLAKGMTQPESLGAPIWILKYGLDSADKWDLALSMLQYNLPEADILYDGEAHGVDVVAGENTGTVHVVYSDQNGNTTEEAPTEPGVYNVAFYVEESSLYKAAQFDNVGSFTIYTLDQTDWQTLMAAYQSVGQGEGWKQPWDFSAGIVGAKDLHGITYKQGRVVGIDLSSNGLTGNMPVMLLSLSALRTLDLSNNQLTGDPGMLTAAFLKQNGGRTPTVQELNIAGNQFSGNVGILAACFPNMTTLDASRNSFEDVYPMISPTVTSLDLSQQTINRVVDLHLAHLGVEDIATKVPSILLYDHQNQTFTPNINLLCSNQDNSWSMMMSYQDGVLAVPYVSEQNTYYGENGDMLNVSVVDSDGKPEGSTFRITLSFDDGDANFDGQVNILDLQTTLNYMFEEYTNKPYNFTASNLWKDDVINVQDAVSLVNMLLDDKVAPAPYMKASRMVANKPSEISAYVLVENGYLKINSVVPIPAFDIMVLTSQQTEVLSALNDMGFTCQSKQNGNILHIVGYSLNGMEIPAGVSPICKLNEGVVSYVMLADRKANEISVSQNGGASTSVQTSLDNPSSQEVYRIPLGARRAITIDSEGKKAIIKN